MTAKFQKEIKQFLPQLLGLTLFAFLLHSYLLSHIAEIESRLLPLWQIYIFIAVTVLLIYSWILFKVVKGNTEVFNYFMIGTMLKMILALVFLIPVFISELDSKRADVFNFFIPYFIFLAFEVFVITRLINSKTE